MEEIELIEHANDYIKQMARGINPLTGEQVSENDLINDVKISRCLYYVSEILNRYIENGGTKRKRKKFYARSEEYINFNYSNTPIYLSAIVERINEIVDTNKMRKLSPPSLSKWLISKGYLTTYYKEDGRTSKKPTPMGEELGITQKEVTGKNGSYMVNVYDINAQKYIVNNIEDISKSIQ